jgi:hypothetical protein
MLRELGLQLPAVGGLAPGRLTVMAAAREAIRPSDSSTEGASPSAPRMRSP